ncbi:PREDICTED: probable GPI-anchored adhesin-like protein PGA55 [Ipomoea nil]|uniref:probable GPI-anchored adhesin-like protein PGA55 n=1 Tax=Ipomoea nil TaxID=35883 RepID=UPI00090112AD|nr:PREDICTED: probable GPI-anchored adhesin-like protein PGA55 [Ipomoea nil]
MFSMNQDSSSSFVSKIHYEDQQYGFAERRDEDLGSSMVNQSSDDPESVAEQISTSSSSSSSSSTSMSQTKFSLDLASSNWDQEPQMEVPQSQNQIAETTHQVTYDISNPTTSHESLQLLADIPTVHHQEREILNIDSTKEIEGLPKLETTAPRSESYDHDKFSEETGNSSYDLDKSSEETGNNHMIPLVIHEDTQNKDSIAETKGLPKLETSAHHSEPHDREKYFEEIRNNHMIPLVIHEDTQNKDSVAEIEGLPELETSAHHSEPHDCEKYSEKTSTSNHTNASVIPGEVLKIDYIEKTEGLPKREITTHRLESNDHKYSSKETSSDNHHTNAPVIQKEIQNTNSIKEAGGPPELEMTKGDLPRLNEERGLQGPSMAENKEAKMIEGAAHLKETVQKPVAKETSTNNHTNVASVIPEEIFKIDCTEETERLPKQEITTNHLESNNHEKSSNETSNDNHTNASVMVKGAAHLEGTIQKPVAEETSTSNHTNAVSVIPEEILKIDCTKETERLPKSEMTTNRLESNDHEKSSNETSSDNHTNASVMVEGTAHLEGTVQKGVAEETSTSNHTNAASVIPTEILKIDCTEETERPPKPEMTTNRLEPNDHEKSSNKTNSDNHTNAFVMTEGETHLEGKVHKPIVEETSTSNHTNAASVISEAILKIDCTEEAERLPKSEMTTNRLEPNDHEKSSNETNIDNHTNASLIQPGAAVKSDVNNVVQSECRSFSVNEVSNFDVSKAVNEKSNSTHRLELNDHEKSSNETSSGIHTNASVIQPVAAVKSNVNNVVESEPRSFIVNEVSNFDVSKVVNEKSDSTHRLESNDHEKSSNKTSSDNHTNASVIQPVAAVKSDVNNVVESEPRSFIVNEVSNFDVSKAVNEKSDSTHHLESNDHEKSSNETSSDNHTNASVIHQVAAVKSSDVNNVVESEPRSFIVNEVNNFDASKAVNEKSNSTHRLESNDHEKSSNEPSSDTHTNASIIQPVAAVKSDVNNVVESEPRSFIVNEVSNFDVSKDVNEKSDSTHRLESNDHEKSSNKTSSDNHTNASVIPPVAAVRSSDVNDVVESEPRSFIVNEVSNFDVSKAVNEKSDSTHRLESNDHDKSSNETSSDNHTNAFVTQPVAAVKSNVNNVVESESISFTVNEVGNFDVSKAVNEKSDSTHSANSIEREATPDLSEKPIENEREIPNLIIVNNDNDKAPSFQGSHEGESSRGLPSHDFVTKQPQTSQSVHPSKGQDLEGEHWIQNEADAATSTSRGDAGKDHGSQDSEKPMNSENASDHQKANETNIGSGERDYSNTNLKD